jgi:hypothetical protein
LIEALTGAPAFDSDDPRSILETDPVAVALDREKSHARRRLLGFAPVLRRSLAKRPSERYATARELRAALIERHQRGVAA